jgi:hypothetical protein
MGVNLKVLDFSTYIHSYHFMMHADAARTEIEDKGNLSYGIKARLFYPINKNLNCIPMANFEWIDASFIKKGEKDTTEHLYSSKTIEGGMGLDYTHFENAHLIIGILGRTNETTTEDTVKSTILPKVVVGIEIPVKHYFRVRCGASKSIIENEKRSTTVDDITTSPFDISLGWELKFNRFALDIKSDGLDFSSSMISAVYSF